MANPPVNRRPGVDADIFQGTWVRGYDVPAGDQTLPPPDPCDLLVTNGKSEIDQSVSNLIFANRTDDIGQPIFVMALGTDPTSPLTTANVHLGRDDDPNGLISGVGPGSLYIATGVTPALWQIQADDTTWVKISDDLGGENLEETLAIGNFTGNNPIVLSNQPLAVIIGEEDSSGGDGGGAAIFGGPATGATGDGGRVVLSGGTSVGGATGDVAFTTPVAAGTGVSGGIQGSTGGNTTGGNSGGVFFVTGDIGAPGIAGTSGTITLRTGASFDATGVLGVAGDLNLETGNAFTDGQAGNISLNAGGASAGLFPPPIIPPVAGQGGRINLRAGLSSLTQPGGDILLQGGTGGSGGARGGNINLQPGFGGGGFPQGEILGTGNLSATNIKRGTGDPNAGAGTPGNEGDVYQRIDTGIGELWLNTNGSQTGWLQLAFAGDFIESFNQMQWGYLAPTAKNVGATDNDNFQASGILHNIEFDDNGTGGFIQRGASLSSGVTVQLSAPAVADFSALDMDSGVGAPPHRASYQFAAHFAAFLTDSTDSRIFMGFSTASGPNQLAAGNADPAGAEEYIGFVADPGLNPNWRVLARGPGGPTDGPFSTGVPIASTSIIDAWHFVIDTSLYPTIQFFIFDEDLVLLSSTTLNTSVPGALVNMGMIIGTQRIGVGGGAFHVNHATVVNQKGIVATGAGAATTGLTLAQVLNNGNETGAQLIQINQGGGIVGVVDDNLGDGARYDIFSGATTGAGNDTGFLTVGSASRAFIAGTGETGGVLFGSGVQFDAPSTGVTGDVVVTSGRTFGSGTTGTLTLATGIGDTGDTGSIVIATGFHTGAGGAQGDILIGPGSFTPTAATTTGEVQIKGGSSTLVGITGGAVRISSGENSSANGDSGDIIVETFPGNATANTGGLELKTGDAGVVAGTSGNIDIETGDGIAGGTGAIAITTGDAGNGSAGPIIVGVGATSTGAGPDLTLQAGTTADAGALGGNIIMNPGAGGLGSGAVIVNGKLTVTGLIDPTGMLFSGVGAVPSPVGGGEGLIWVDNNAVPSRLFFRDDTGTSHDISTGGGATTLGALTDVTIAAPAPGEVLMLNGALQWVNAAGVGGSPLSTILLTGNTTGATPIVVEDSLGSRITSDGDLILDPAVAPGDAVVIDGMRWPEADGLGGYVLTTNGLGDMSWQPGGGGGGSTFAQAFTQMQWGTFQPNEPTAPPVGASAIAGFFNAISELSIGPGGSFSTVDGIVVAYETGGIFTDAFVETSTSKVDPGSGFFSSFKFSTTIAGLYRSFVGLTINPAGLQLGISPAPGAYVGLLLDTGIAPTYQFITATAGVPTLVDTTVLPGASSAFWVEIDATTPGAITLTLYDAGHNVVGIGSHTFAANLPPLGSPLGHMAGIHNLEPAPTKSVNVWSFTTVTRADLLAAVGGGGNQNLASVLGFGNESGGIPIKGDDNVAGPGGSLDLLGGTSTGGGGDGGAVSVITGTPDFGGNGGAFVVTTSGGAGPGDGGAISLLTGGGGPGGGDGGAFVLGLGSGTVAGSGGSFIVNVGNSGTGGGAFAGTVGFTTGAGGVGSGATGGRFNVITGAGDGAGNGGGVLYTTGAGGAGGGDGGSFIVTLGAGGGGGNDGIFQVIGDVDITGKLTVGGMIDPPGLLMSSSVGVPFTPAGSEGGIWVNGAGELIFTNLGGDLNLSTAIGGGLGFLDAMLISSYGFMAPGNPIAGPQSYGVYGSSVNFDVTPPGAQTFGTDSDGPILTHSLGAVAGAQAYNSTLDLTVSRDQQFKAVFKFQSTSPAHTDERIFIGFTDDASATTPTTQLGADHPVGGLQYMGLAQDLAGFNLEFVAQGSGGAMGAVFAIPTDALVHYLQIDATDPAGSVTFNLYAADGVTLEATHTQPNAGLLLPDLSLPTRPFVGLASAASTTPRTLDFYFSSIMTRADIVDAVSGGGGGGTPALDAVLAAGNTTGVNNILVSAGAQVRGETGALTIGGADTGGGGESGLVLMFEDSGDDGGDVRVIGGPAGATGDGGNLDLNAGDGAFGGAGSGGAVNVNTGNGGSTGGFAGIFGVTTGDGLAANATGGRIRLDAGDSHGTTPGAPVELIAGDGGSGGGSGDGGAIRLEAGSPLGTGAEGAIVALAGSAVAPFSGEGAITLVGAPTGGAAATSGWFIVDRANPTFGHGGSLVGLAGTALAASGGDGGSVVLQAGALDPGGDNGHIYLFGDGALPIANFAPGGDIQIAGATDPGSALGGRLHLDGGGPVVGGWARLLAGNADAGSGLPGGSVGITGGAGDGVGPGGPVVIGGGAGGATGDGGIAILGGGAATGGVNTGGDVALRPGVGPGGDGQIRIEGKIDPAVPVGPGFQPGLQYGAFAIPAGPGPHPIPFNVAFAAPPTTVTFVLEQPGAFPGQDVVIVTGSITTAKFDILASTPFGGGEKVHWVAFQ